MKFLSTALLSKSLICVLCFLPAAALAFDFINCEVGEIVIAGTQNAHVQLSCTPANLPPCAANNPYVAFDKSTPEGKQYLALFISAQATNAKVTGFVANSCPAFQGNVAWLSHLRVRR